MSRRVERVRVGTATLPELAAHEIAEMLSTAVRERGRASLALAGGTTPRAAYERLAAETVPWASVSIYFGDERCVPPDHSDSNYRMAHEALFARLPQPPAQIERMAGESSDYDGAARAYEGVLPEALDVLVLGVGEDGHTASLFPGSSALFEATRRVLPVIGPKPPPQRLTITPPVLKAARSVVVLAAGAGKAPAVARALEGELDISSCPSQLVRDALWLMDHAAAAELSGKW
ncbi:MAG: 6-phosphogluconolactonase [Myxococcota bacterium]